MLISLIYKELQWVVRRKQTNLIVKGQRKKLAINIRENLIANQHIWKDVPLIYSQRNAN